MQPSAILPGRADPRAQRGGEGGDTDRPFSGERQPAAVVIPSSPLLARVGCARRTVPKPPPSRPARPAPNCAASLPCRGLRRDRQPPLAQIDLPEPRTASSPRATDACSGSRRSSYPTESARARATSRRFLHQKLGSPRTAHRSRGKESRDERALRFRTMERTGQPVPKCLKEQAFF